MAPSEMLMLNLFVIVSISTSFVTLLIVVNQILNFSKKTAGLKVSTMASFLPPEQYAAFWYGSHFQEKQNQYIRTELCTKP